MANYVVSDTSLGSVADAIRTKGGTSAPLEYPQGFIDAIDAISGGGDEPIPTDGKMHIWIDIPSTATGSRLNMSLRWTQTVSNGVEVDWGDGTAPVTYSGTGAANHFYQYAQGGKYEIKISVLNGEIKFDNSSGSSQTWDAIYGSADGLGNYWCHRITGIYCPFEITTIAKRFFSSMFGLRFLLFPNAKLASLNDYAIYNAYVLSIIDFGNQNTFTSIPGYTFYGNMSMTTLTIPKRITSIGQYAFGNCYGMSEYHFKRTTPPTLASTNAFYNIPSDCIIYVPRGSLNAYKTATNWSTYASKMQEEPT